MLNPHQILERYQKFARDNPRYLKTIDLTYLPLQRYKAYEKWLPKPVETLFLAESPPWNHNSAYFYNAKQSGGLSNAVFEHLGILGGSKDTRLHAFKKKGFFLTDTIKCIFTKKRVSSPPDALVSWSAREILQPELQTLKPKTILALGRTALRGLRTIEPFEKSLSKYPSITAASGKTIVTGDKTIVLSVHPNERNRRHSKTITAAFDKVGGSRL